MQPRLGCHGLYVRTLVMSALVLLCFSTHGLAAPTPVSTPKKTNTTLSPTTTRAQTTINTLTPTPTSTEVFRLPTPTSTSPLVPVPTTPEGVLFMLASTFGGCPPPLVPNTQNLVSKACQGPCCLACPASAVFYEPGQVDTLNHIISSMRVVSCSVTLILAISYLVLPGRRQHPHLIILCMFVTTSFWEGMGTVWLFRKRSLTCHSQAEEATMSNSVFCGIQGIALVYLVGVLFVQGLTLIVNLHGLIVYRSSRVQQHVSKMICLSFVLPLALVVAPAVKKKYSFSGYGSICFMSSDYVNQYFFYPVGAMMVFGVLVHLATVMYMIKTYVTSNQDWSGATVSGSQPSAGSNPHLSSASVSGTTSQLSRRQKRVQTARDISRLLKQQWRPGAFAICQLVIYLVYFGFYFIEIQKFDRIQATSEWFQQWTMCLGQQAVQNILRLVASSASAGTVMTMNTLLEPGLLNQLGQDGQRACIPMAKDNVPQFWKLCLSDAAPTVFGIAIFFIFGSKYELWQDWRRFFLEKVLRQKQPNTVAPSNQVNALDTVKRKSFGTDRRSGGLDRKDSHGYSDHDDDGHDYIAMKERKDSYPPIVSETNIPPPSYPLRQSSSGKTTKTNNYFGGGSRANLTMVTEDESVEPDDRFVPYHPPPPAAQPSLTTPSLFPSSSSHSGNSLARQGSSGGSIKRSVSFQKQPTILGGGEPTEVSLNALPPPVPSTWSTYGGPTARRPKKQQQQQQSASSLQPTLHQPKYDTNDIVSAYMYSPEQQSEQVTGVSFYKDLENIPESVAPSVSPSPSIATPVFDPTIYYTIPLASTPIPSASAKTAMTATTQRTRQDQLREQQEARAQNVMDGTEPWPSWPSTPAATADMADHGPPAVVVKGHRVRKQLSVLMENLPNAAMTTGHTHSGPSSPLGEHDRNHTHDHPPPPNTEPHSKHGSYNRQWSPVERQGRPIVTMLRDVAEGNQEDQDRIQRRNQLRPSPLSTTANAGVSGTFHLPSATAPMSPVSPRSNLSPSPAPWIPPRSKSRPSFRQK